jgi:hypothetical protein
MPLSGKAGPGGSRVPLVSRHAGAHESHALGREAPLWRLRLAKSGGEFSTAASHDIRDFASRYFVIVTFPAFRGPLVVHAASLGVLVGATVGRHVSQVTA